MNDLNILIQSPFTLYTLSRAVSAETVEGKLFKGKAINVVIPPINE
jgi:hypothetical protein